MSDSDDQPDQPEDPATTADHETGEDPGGLPEDLDASAYRGPYTFPDVKRRRLAGAMYLALAGFCVAAWLARGSDPVLVNRGLLGTGLFLLVAGVYHLVTAFPLAVQATEALVAAAAKVQFPVGHASAQLGWRGLLSRPTWRILVYSGEERPAQRGLVLVDGVDGTVVSHFVEPNPEDWSTTVAERS